MEAETVEVFKTDVQKVWQAEKIIGVLRQLFPGSRINFDLEDCDKILRVEGKNICLEKIKALLNGSGFLCTVLE